MITGGGAEPPHRASQLGWPFPSRLLSGSAVPPAATKVIALDGPSGSGKSTVARGVARSLGWRYVDTGATYRAATLAVLRAGTDLADAVGIGSVVEAAEIDVSTDPVGAAVRLAGGDVAGVRR